MTHIWRQRMPTGLQMSQADPRDDEFLLPMCGGKNMHVLWSATYSTHIFGEWSANSFQHAHDNRRVSVPSWLTSQRFTLRRDESKIRSCVLLECFDLLRMLQVGEAVPRKPVQASTRLRRRASCVVTKVWKRFWERGAGGEKSYQD